MRINKNTNPADVKLNWLDPSLYRRCNSLAVAMMQRARYNKQATLETIANANEPDGVKVIATAIVVQGNLDGWFLN